MDLIQLTEKLKGLKNREDGFASLETLKGEDLRTNLKLLDIESSGKVSFLKEKIIEGTIGYKLRSQSIQKNL